MSEEFHPGGVVASAPMKPYVASEFARAIDVDCSALVAYVRRALHPSDPNPMPDLATPGWRRIDETIEALAYAGTTIRMLARRCRLAAQVIGRGWHDDEEIV